MGELENVKVRDPESVRKIASLREKLHNQQAQPRAEGPEALPFGDRVRELLERKRVVCSRAEDTEESAKASIKEIDMINEALQLHKGTSDPLYIELETKWRNKLSDLDRLLLLISSLKKLLKAADKCQNSAEAERLKTDMIALGRVLDNEIHFSIPLLENTKLRLRMALSGLDERFLEKSRHERRRNSLRRKLESLRMSPEEDLPIAIGVVKVS